MPEFSQASMKAYVTAMLDIARQLMDVLDRFAAEGRAVDVPDEMTRLTLDTIALCGFSDRFGSFQRTDPPPFAKAMVTLLAEQQSASSRPEGLDKLMIKAKHRSDQAKDLMEDTVRRVIAERRAGGTSAATNDLLQRMLDGIDKQTGEGLDEANIITQCITLLVAGHETTSGLLSFASYFLIKNPDIQAKAADEAIRVLGPDPNAPPEFDQIHALRYIEMVLKESLRLWPTAPMFTRAPREDTVLGDKYFLPRGQPVTLLLPILHRAKSVWGDDAESFRPERHSPEAEEKRPPYTFLPFGTGPRSCIGRQFALQEAKLVMGMLLQRFRLRDHGNYQLHLRQSLTIKPADFLVELAKRTEAERAAVAAAPSAVAPAPKPAETAAVTQAAGLALRVLFGSNMGGCEGFAGELDRQGQAHGCRVTSSPLDDAVGNLPAEGVVAVVCSSYNGLPPDNAAAFVSWLDQGAPGQLKDVRFAVFGCGNKDWTNTYQQVPRRIDQRLAELGATRLLDRGEGDARGDLDGGFRAWCTTFWNAVAKTFDLSAPSPAAPEPLLDLEVVEDPDPNPFAEAYKAVSMVVTENRELNGPEAGRSTRHLELVLPEGASYRPGDHLGVIAENSAEDVARAAARFDLTPATRIRIHQTGPGKTALPLDRIVSVGSVLARYVELHETAARRHLEVLAGHAGSPVEKKTLEALSADETVYDTDVRRKNRTLMDLLEDFPSVRLPFSHYLELLPPLRPRYYSISSSPLMSGRILSITVGVVSAPARSGHGIFKGATSNYLAGVPRGRGVPAFLQEAPAFHLPGDAALPIIMIGAGTGLAPFRGFLQERAALKSSGRTVGKALLFFGCRHADQDYLYRDELTRFEEQGLLTIATAFSRSDAAHKVYVQDRVLEHGDRVWDCLQDDGAIYVCGDASGMSAGVRKSLQSIVSSKLGMPADDAGAWLDDLARKGRYALDVWASD